MWERERECVLACRTHVKGTTALALFSLMDNYWKAIHWGDFSQLDKLFPLIVLCCSPAPQAGLSTSFLYNPAPCPSRRRMTSSGKQWPASAWGFDFCGFILHVLILQETPCRCGGALNHWPLVRRQTARNQKHDREDKQLFRSQLLAGMAMSSQMSLALLFTEETSPWSSFV